MGLFDFLKSKPKSEIVGINEMIIEKNREESESICPHCGGVLENKPQRKKNALYAKTIFMCEHPHLHPIKF